MKLSVLILAATVAVAHSAESVMELKKQVLNNRLTERSLLRHRSASQEVDEWGWAKKAVKKVHKAVCRNKCFNSVNQRHTADCNSQGKNGPIRVGNDANLDERLKGVWWLQEQGPSSALMSFASSGDGCGDSTGNSNSNSYKVRVFGDKVWSFHDDTFIRTLVQTCDLTYAFRFERDSRGRVNHAAITPTGCGLTVPNGWFLAFNMTYKESAKYPNSHVWERNSFVAGSEAESKRYDLVQVQDKNGNKLQPAFDEWVNYCNDKAETGGTPGKFHYASVKEPSKTECVIFG